MSQATKARYNPHYHWLAYAVFEEIVILFGTTPEVDDDNPTILIDEKVTYVGWKANVNDQWYGDFVKVETDEKQINDAMDILYDQAVRSIKEIIKK